MDSDLTPQNNRRYQDKDYWDERYAKCVQHEILSSPHEYGAFSFRDGGFHDWFKGYSELKSVLDELVPDRTARILMLGCGNSALSKDMWEAGYKNIVNIDYSPVVIEHMRAAHSSMEGMTWLEMDIRHLKFEEGTFDVVIDKGTMDAMLAGVKDVWNPPQDIVDNCNAEVQEAIRVLRPNGGTFIYLTFAQPHFRRQYLQQPGTTLETKPLGDMFHYYLFVVRK